MSEDLAPMAQLRLIIEQFFQSLENISQDYREVYDTDVRDHISDAVYYYVVWGHPLGQVPLSYSMFSSEGNVEVSRAVAAFVRAAVRAANSEGIKIGAERHRALQDRSIVTLGGRRYDHFIGHSDKPLRIQELPAYRFQNSGG